MESLHPAWPVAYHARVIEEREHRGGMPAVLAQTFIAFRRSGKDDGY
jgi:hypothetical protein